MKHTKQAFVRSVIALVLCVSMFVGTTFAWFTDSVTSMNNLIQTGILDVELEWLNHDGQWEPVTEQTNVFEEDALWEPGHTEVVYLRVINKGSLALKYQLGINVVSQTMGTNVYGDRFKLSDYIEMGAVDASTTYATREAARDAVTTSGTLSSGYTTSGSMSAGDAEQYLALVVYMPEEVGNVANYKTGTTPPTINLGITLLATQMTEESDSIGPDYDADAQFPTLMPGSVTVEVTPDANGILTEDVTVISSTGALEATIPAGTKVAEGTTALTLSVSEMTASGTNITLQENEILRSMDVHIEGLAEDNAVPAIITVKEAMMTGLNMGNYALYHVENDAPVTMTYVNSVDALDAHNQFCYDPATGDVTLAMASFSPVLLTADTENAWNGAFDYDWYNATAAALTIANADQLAGFGAIVGGMDGQTQDSFSGKTVKLISDINLGDNNNASESLIFHPIGYYYTDDKNADGTTGDYYSTVQSFEGTFDGNGHTIANFYQNTWEIKGDYDGNYYSDAMGLFGYVVNGKVCNLTVDNFSSDGEFTPTGVIAAYAVNSTFENIAITNCNPRVYNTGNGGIIGIAGSTSTANDDHITLKNITVDNSNKISALWGSWDVACGGLVGMYRGNVDGSGNATGDTISFTNCHVAAQIDVYNDVCANYQYYAYRYAGMIIGSVRHNTTNAEGKTIPNMTGISASSCTVNYGDWNDYYYCEFEKNTMASYSEDYQFSRVSHSELNFTDSNGNGMVDADERSSVTGCKHNHTDAEDKQAVYLPFHQLFTGYSWGVSSIGLKEYSGIVTDLGITEGDQENSVIKFKSETDSLANNKTYNISDIFEFVDNRVKVRDDSLVISITNLDKNGNVTAVYMRDSNNWKDSTIKFSNTGRISITIQDYYFCTPTTIVVNITDREEEEKFEVAFDHDSATEGKQNYVDTYLYRVGNQNTVTLSSLFAAKAGATIGTVSVTVEALNGTAASGAYTANATWTNGTIQFSGTGVVKVTITDNDYCTPTELYLEVVDAVNATSATDATANNVVLLNDISSGFTVSGEYTVFGNGFTLNYTGNGQYLNNGLRQGVVNISENGRLDNLRIEASIYPAAYLYYDEVKSGPSSVDGDKTRYHYQLSAVVAKGNATISNCYIYGGRTNIFVDTGNVTITDTITECGTLANIQIQSTNASTVTLTNVTTIQKRVNATIGDTTQVMMGAGVIVGPDTETNPTIVLNGEFKQYNWVNSEDSDNVTNSTAKNIIKTALDATAFNHTVNGTTASNLGIIYLNIADATVKNYTGLPYQFGNVSMMNQDGKVYSLQNATESQIYSDVEKADRSTVNGDYLPTFNFDLGDQEISYDGSEDTRYLYGDKSGVTALYQDGDDALALDLTKLATIYKYDGINYTVTAVCKDSSGNALTQNNGVVTLNAQGNYTLVFTVDDNIFYNEKGEKIDKSVTRTFVVPVTLTVKEADVKNAEVNITETALDGVYTTVNVTDYKLRINFLDCISVTDYDNNGTGTTVDLTSNISSATLTPSSVNVFTTASTITVTYTDGRVLTVNLSKISGSSAGTKTATVNTSGGLYFITDGALNNKPTEASSQNKCTITSVSYKGNSGSTVTNDTDVTVTWALGSSSSGGGCVTGDTLVTLADGSKKQIGDLSEGEMILVWNFFEGKFEAVPAAKVLNHGYGDNTVVALEFDDGSVVKLVNNHQFYNIEANEYITLNEFTAKDYIGKTFAKNVNGEMGTAKLVDFKVSYEYCEAWATVSAYHYNILVEDFVTIDFKEKDVPLFTYFEVGSDLKFDEEQMRADIEKYGLYTYNDFSDYITREQFEAFNFKYMKIAVGKGTYTYAGILEMIEIYLNN